MYRPQDEYELAMRRKQAEEEAKQEAIMRDLAAARVAQASVLWWAPQGLPSIGASASLPCTAAVGGWALEGQGR